MSPSSGKQPEKKLNLDFGFRCGSSHRPEQKTNRELGCKLSSECLLVFLCCKTGHLFWMLVCIRPTMTEIDSASLITHSCHPESSRSGEIQWMNIASNYQVQHRALMISTVVMMIRFHQFFEFIIYGFRGLEQNDYVLLSSCQISADKTRSWPTL